MAARRALSRLVIGAALACSLATCSVCNITGQDAPNVRTLMASTVEPVVAAWIVNPNCSYELVQAVHDPDAFFTVEVQNVERVESVPTNTLIVKLEGGLSRGADFSAAKRLDSVYLTAATSITDLIFPASTRSISLRRGSVENIDKLRLPSLLDGFHVMYSQLDSYKNVKLPDSLEMLTLAYSQLTEVDFELPPRLTTFDITSNPISKFERLQLPETLRVFSCMGCKISSVRGVNFPKALTSISMGDGRITSFEVREFDVPALKPMANQIHQSTCSDPTAKLVKLEQGNVCVISDDRFEELYGIGLPPPPGPTPSSTSAPSSSTTNPAPSLDLLPPSPSPTHSTTQPTPTARPPTARLSSGSLMESSEASTTGASRSTSTSIEPSKQDNSSRDITSTGNTRIPLSGKNNGSSRAKLAEADSDTNEATGGSVGSEEGATVNSPPSKSTSTLLIVAVSVVGAVGVLVGTLVCRVAPGTRRSEREGSTASDAFSRLASPAMKPSTAEPPSELPSPKYLANDIRKNPQLAQLRIDRSAIALGDPIARGGFGVIYKGVYGGQPVVLKRMLSDTWRNEGAVASFMDEIRMCFALNHPKIVQCIGISWTSLRDLSVVIEYMDGGDLHSVLQSQSDQPITGREWTELWTQFNINSKMSIAADVAEAIAYLHAFSTPIIHRDLKAKNVLLDTEGNAKLSDFGISREVSMDETMTREIGTVAWIAPEVLRGERYSEKADIYSFGVLLVELDRCSHPYAQVLEVVDIEDPLPYHQDSLVVIKNTKIAIQVSAGTLRPMPSTSCPYNVKQLLGRCLAFDPADRPTAQQVCKALSELRTSQHG